MPQHLLSTLSQLQLEGVIQQLQQQQRQLQQQQQQQRQQHKKVLPVRAGPRVSKSTPQLDRSLSYQAKQKNNYDPLSI